MITNSQRIHVYIINLKITHRCHHDNVYCHTSPRHRLAVRITQRFVFTSGLALCEQTTAENWRTTTVVIKRLSVWKGLMWQHQCSIQGLYLQTAICCLFLYPTWDSALIAKQQEIKLECTCLLGWPTSSILFNYSRALKCSSVWPHATRVPLFAPHDSSLTEVLFMHERVQACVYSVRMCMCAYFQTLMLIQAGFIYTHHTKQNI